MIKKNNAEQDSAQYNEISPGDPGKGWTLGDSNALSPHGTPEPKWVSAAWIIIPTLLALVVVAMMMNL